MRYVEVAQCPDVTRVRTRDLCEQVAPVPEQQFHLFADFRKLLVTGYVPANGRHDLLDMLVERREFAALFLDTHLRQPDFGERSAPLADFCTILRNLRQVAAFVDEQAADYLGDAADLETLLRPRQALFDIARLALDPGQFAGDALDVRRDGGQFARELDIAFGDLSHGRMLASGLELGERRLLQGLGRTDLPLRVDGSLQYFEFAPQVDQRASRDVASRFGEFEPYAVADDLLVEPVEFRRAGVQFELPGQLASVREHRRLARWWRGVDRRCKLVHTAAQLIDPRPRFCGTIGQSRDLGFELGQPGLSRGYLGELGRQPLFEVGQRRRITQAHRLGGGRRRCVLVQLLAQPLSFGGSGLDRLGKIGPTFPGGSRVLQLCRGIAKLVDNLGARFLIQSVARFDRRNSGVDLLGRDRTVRRQWRNR